MNRKIWKQTHKRFGKNKLKRKRTGLTRGQSMQRRPTELKKRGETK